LEGVLAGTRYSELVKSPAELQKVYYDLIKEIRFILGKDSLYMLERQVEKLHNCAYYTGYDEGYRDGYGVNDEKIKRR
jgi:hypothetical protein